MMKGDDWGHIRYNTIMSEAKCGAFPNMDLWTPSNEAFLWINTVNCQRKWIKSFQHYKDQGDYTAKIPPRLSKAERDAATPEEIAENDEFHHTEFTSATAGQVKSGTFSDDGIAQYTALMEEIKLHIKDHYDERVAVEKAFLKKYLQQQKKRGVDNDGGGKKKKAKRAGDGVDSDEEDTLEDVMDITF